MIELTEEETLILKHYALGRTRGQIIELMTYTHSALSKICSKLKRKLGLDNETQLILYAYKIARVERWKRWQV